MSLAACSPQTGVLPGIVQETMLLNYFAASGEFLHVAQSNQGDENYFLAKVGSGNAAGFGRALSKRLACVKAIAENFERKLMLEIFGDKLRDTPFCFQTSNGFAVHFAPELAQSAALAEALERHILQMTYFRHGWAGFYPVGRPEMVGDLKITKLLSRYVCNGYRAGIVVATSPRFSGASFGYMCDRADNAMGSIRWEHAVHEAVDKIEPFLSLAESNTKNLLPITREILYWLTTPVKIDPSVKSTTEVLPSFDLSYETFDLTRRWGLDFPFWGAFATGNDLLPLIVPGRISDHDSERIRALFAKFGIQKPVDLRNPIL